MAKTQETSKNAHVRSALATPTDLAAAGVVAIGNELRGLLADVFALYVKTKNFHWHMSGPHFRDYHLLLDEQSEQIFAMTDDLAERARKIGATSCARSATLRATKDWTTITTISSNRVKCSSSCLPTTRSSSVCSAAPTRCAMSTTTSPRPA